MSTKTNQSESTYNVKVPQHKAGERLDRFLADALEDLSRSRIQALVGEGYLKRENGDGDTVSLRHLSRKVKTGEAFALFVPASAPARPQPQDIPLDVVYEDDYVIVINKPSGLVVHPAPGNFDGTLVNALLAHCKGSLSGICGIERPGIVHRLDKDTSGLLVAAKNDIAQASLSEQFAAHSVERAYYAIVWGVPRRGKGELSGNVGRNPRNRKKMAVLKSGGKKALTRYRVIRTFKDVASFIECRLSTGRTHQIRVHMSDLGHPVVGDPLYGGKTQKHLKVLPQTARRVVDQLNRLALHAYLLGFIHPYKGEHINFEANVPNKIKELEYTLDNI
jgi:23S rRNA pseudouridine1911/1915/1917 synthase